MSFISITCTYYSIVYFIVVNDNVEHNRHSFWYSSVAQPTLPVLKIHFVIVEKYTPQHAAYTHTRAVCAIRQGSICARSAGRSADMSGVNS